ncbi:ACP S-malonyltransferase [Gammaproteobacteria bacterium]|nr:ACP S-malonyltransferase [Gammaproteobacteria bacterium]
MKQGLGFIFPGQGSQKVGMLSELGQEFAVVKSTFDEASAVLAYDLWELVQHDSKDELNQTQITQPAILTSSVAIWRLWLEQGGAKPVLMAGHSLGEYSAMVCGGVLSFSDAVALVSKRGEFMQSAVPVGVGSMAAIVGLDDHLVIAACTKAEQGEVVAAVNFNSPGQVVIAGHTQAVERAIELCKEAGAKRALSLPVSAPFHSVLMEPAAERFASELDAVTFNTPDIPVLQNYGLEASSEPTQIRDKLLKQIFNPVPWVGTIEGFSERGINTVFELGPGKVLCGLNKRIAPAMACHSINDTLSLQNALMENQE